MTLSSNFIMKILSETHKFKLLTGIIICSAIIVRIVLGLGQYHGYHNPPMYGDFET